MSTTKTTEILTDNMIRALRSEAAAAGDDGLVWACDDALDGKEDGREEVCQAINSARAMDDSKPYVRLAASLELAALD